MKAASLKNNLFGLKSGKRDSNSRPQPWQGCALPTELFPHCFSDCECKGTTFSQTDKTFQEKNILKMFFLFDASPYTLIIYKKGGSEAPFYRILSSERTNASSLRIPWMARQLRMMLSIGKTTANFRWKVGDMHPSIPFSYAVNAHKSRFKW